MSGGLKLCLAWREIASRAFGGAADEIRQWWPPQYSRWTPLRLTGERARDVKFIRRTISRISAGFEFLYAEFVIIGEQGHRRSYIYVTGAGGQIVKIRVTLGNDDEASTVADNFMSSVVTHFVTRELTWDISPEPMALDPADPRQYSPSPNPGGRLSARLHRAAHCGGLGLHTA
jgi:hypothetical protein